MTSKASVLIFLTLILLMAGCTSPKSVSVQVPEPEYWPTTGWKNSAPELQGMDSELLAQMLEDISSNETSIYSVLVIRNGYIVTEAYFHPYRRDTKMHIQSVTKSVVGMLIGIAIEDGFIKNAETRLSDFYRLDMFEHPAKQKESIKLKHLLSMSSGLNCQEFSTSGTHMEQTDGWVRFILNQPLVAEPGERFGYCNGNAHLLSAVVGKSTDMTARELANTKLFQPLGIPAVALEDWASDPQKITMGGYGLHIRPIEMAKLAFLYLHNGEWNGQQILSAQWVADSTAEHIQKEDGSGYGYLWTVYPQAGHYAALGMGGQQIHVYPSKNLIIVVTASLESYAEAPEIEKINSEYVLPAIKSDDPLTDNQEGYSRLLADIETAANPVQPAPLLPPLALNISGSVYTFRENPLGWRSLKFIFEEGMRTAQIHLNDDATLEVGLDNIYRLSKAQPFGEILLRGQWADEHTFLIDYPYSMGGATTLGELGETEIQFKFSGTDLEVTVNQLPFGGEPIVFEGEIKTK